MSLTRVQRKRKRRKTVGLIVLLLMAYLFLKPIVNVISGGLKTSLPNKELLVESVEGQGFFIRSEKTIKADTEGILKKTVAEGSRVGAGIEVANIHSSKDSSSLEREIIELDKAILSLEQSGAKVDDLENNMDNVQDLKQVKIEEIQNKIINKDYKDIGVFKEELVLYEKIENDEDFLDDLSNTSIETLKDRREKISQEVNTNNIKYYTQSGGIISYKVDGYESSYLPAEFEKYTFKKLDSKSYLKDNNSKDEKNSSEIQVNIGQPIFKLIDDFVWYIAIKIDDKKDITELDVNQNVKIKIGEDKAEIKGNIININISDNKAVVVVEFNTMMYEFYHERVSTVQLIKRETEVLKIPNKSLLEKEGQNGVYIKNKGGIIEFKPIFKVKEAGEFVYVQTGDNNSNVYLKKDSEAIRTISLFDEVILNPKAVKEGDIVD